MTVSTSSFQAMAGEVTLQLCGPVDGEELAAATARVEAVFAEVERQCSRFDPSSALMIANASGDRWVDVPPLCLRAITEAARAHALTGGLFDPRVESALRQLGYDRTLAFAGGPVSLPSPAAVPEPPGPSEPSEQLRGRWNPGLDAEGGRVRIGPEPIDLGGIGKGLAIRWATRELRAAAHEPYLSAGNSFAITAGGDCYLAGSGPEGAGWHVGVEDPRGGDAPIAVLSLSDTACATSSLRVRHWTVGGKAVHHLIDPRTGRPGGEGLASVTVVDDDPAQAEVWSKTLFLAGADGIAAQAAHRAALWVTTGGKLECSTAMAEHLIWRAGR